MKTLKKKNTTGQGDDYTTGCLSDYNYFKNHYEMMAVDLIIQRALDARPKAMKRTNFNTKSTN